MTGPGGGATPVRSCLGFHAIGLGDLERHCVWWAVIGGLGFLWVPAPTADEAMYCSCGRAGRRAELVETWSREAWRKLGIHNKDLNRVGSPSLRPGPNAPRLAVRPVSTGVFIVREEEFGTYARLHATLMPEAA